MTRRVRPETVLSPHNLERWFATWTNAGRPISRQPANGRQPGAVKAPAVASPADQARRLPK